jgi:hypothetical protein
LPFQTRKPTKVGRPHETALLMRVGIVIICSWWDDDEG